jgi:hypothetical protein
MGTDSRPNAAPCKFSQLRLDDAQIRATSEGEQQMT